MLNRHKGNNGEGPREKKARFIRVTVVRIRSVDRYMERTYWGSSANVLNHWVGGFTLQLIRILPFLES
jgi:hypothetical protein